MNFIGIWIITIITSVVWEFKNELQMFKEFADNGYKLNVDKMKDIQTNVLPQSNSNLFLNMIIPFYNLASVIRRKSLYENNKQMIFDQYDKLGILEEMTEEEKQEYAKNPTGWNAVLMVIKENDEPKVEKQTKPEQPKQNNTNIVKLIINEENGVTNTVKLDMSLGGDKLAILEINEGLTALSKDELISYVIEHMDIIMQGKNISIKRTEEMTEITLTKVKPKTKLERYIELRDSLKANGFLYGEEMCEYHDLKDEFEQEPVVTIQYADGEYKTPDDAVSLKMTK